MSAGRLRFKIRVERRGKTRNSSGGIVEGWTTVNSAIPAAIYHKGGSEAVLSERLKGVSSMEIKARYSSKTKVITTDDRLIDERSGEAYNVKTVLPDARRRFIFITVTKGTLQ